MSEGGAERVFQGVEARYRFALALAPGKPERVRFRLTMGAARRPAAGVGPAAPARRAHETGRGGRG
jgi:hypothetical protein